MTGGGLGNPGGSGGITEPLTLSQALTLTTAPANAAKTTGAPNALWVANNAAPGIMSGRRFSYWGIAATTATTYDGPVGCGTPDALAVGSPTITAAAGVIFTTRAAIKRVSGATTNNATGVNKTSLGHWDNRHKATFYIATGPDLTNTRIWVGLSAGSVHTSSVTTNRHAMFRFATDVPDAGWSCSTADDTTESSTASGVAVAADTIYKLTVDHSTAGTCLFYINDVLVVTKTTHLPTGIFPMGPYIAITTLADEAKTLYHSTCFFEQN